MCFSPSKGSLVVRFFNFIGLKTSSSSRSAMENTTTAAATQQHLQKKKKSKNKKGAKGRFLESSETTVAASASPEVNANGLSDQLAQELQISNKGKNNTASDSKGRKSAKLTNGIGNAYPTLNGHDSGAVCDGEGGNMKTNGDATVGAQAKNSKSNKVMSKEVENCLKLPMLTKQQQVEHFFALLCENEMSQENEEQAKISCKSQNRNDKVKKQKEIEETKERAEPATSNSTVEVTSVEVGVTSTSLASSSPATTANNNADTVTTSQQQPLLATTNEEPHIVGDDAASPSLDLSNVHIDYKEYESELQMHDIMRLIQAELSEPYSIYTYRYFIYNWPKLCFLAAHGNEYVGAIVCKLDMHMNVRRGYIAMLAVRKEYRKLKIGTTLVQKAIEAMLADNADEVVLETEMRNVPALRLYENLGFVRDKRLFRYYLNGVDALRLKLWFR